MSELSEANRKLKAMEELAKEYAAHPHKTAFYAETFAYRISHILQSTQDTE